jgi:hypothetical protein
MYQTISKEAVSKVHLFVDKDTQERFWNKVDKSNCEGCWLWVGAKNDQGYGRLTFRNRRAYRAHRLSYEMKYGSIPKGLCVLHRCDVRACVRPDHLFTGTRADNNRDAAQKGRTRNGERKGSRHPQAILNEEIAKRVLFLRQTGMGPTEIARTLGYKYSTISNIFYGRAWQHVQKQAA